MTAAFRTPVRLVFAATGLMLVTQAAPAAETYASYDNFTGATQLDPGRWLFPERSRLIKGGVLSMIQRDIGEQTSDTGSYNNSYSTNVSSPASITQMRATMTVNAYEMSSCAGNSTPTTIQARMGGAYFNMGGATPTSRVNDVVAFVRFTRDSNTADASNVLRVNGIIAQCTTADCNSGTVLLNSVDLGQVNVGESLSMRIEWEKTRKRFNFYRGTGAAVRATYTVDDGFAPFQEFRNLSTRTQVANCLTGSRTLAYIDAKFDNFSVNASGAP